MLNQLLHDSAHDVIGRVFVCDEDGAIGVDGVLNEGQNALAREIVCNLRHNLAITLNRPDYGRLPCPSASWGYADRCQIVRYSFWAGPRQKFRLLR